MSYRKAGGLLTVGLSLVLVISAFVVPAVATPTAEPDPLSDKINILAIPPKIDVGESTLIVAVVNDISPFSCAYTAAFTVTRPGGSSATKTVSFTTDSEGDGSASVNYPFTGGSTSAAGTYTVTVLLSSHTSTCPGYLAPTGTQHFTVLAGEDEEAEDD